MSEAEFRKTGVFQGSWATAIPMVLPIVGFDGEVVDAGEAPTHQAVLGELPVLVAIRAVPVAGIIVPLMLR